MHHCPICQARWATDFCGVCHRCKSDVRLLFLIRQNAHDALSRAWFHWECGHKQAALECTERSLGLMKTPLSCLLHFFIERHGRG